MVETQKNNISSQTKLSALAGMMFFAPLVKNSIKSDSKYSEEEKWFIMWYVQVWFVNLAFLILTSIAAITNLFVIHPILSWIVTIWGLAVFIITAFSMLACVSSLSMRNSDESIMQNIQHKNLLAKSYVPGLNFSLWFRQEEYGMPYWRLKESILLWTCFIFGTLLLWSSLGVWILVIIVVRFVLLLMNIDIVPLSMKRSVNSAFSCNPSEIFAYLTSPIIAKFRKREKAEVLLEEKAKYAQWQKLGISIILQYILFIWLLVLIHRWMDFYLVQIVLALAVILWIVKVWVFYRYKKMFLRIPILSELLSLIFH